MQESDENMVMTAIDKAFKKYIANPENLENSANSLVDDLIDDAIMSVVFEVDIMRKARLNEIIQGENDSEIYKIVDIPGLDVFGHSFAEKSDECLCPCCNRSMASSRFAPHLAKCLGKGRNSSRIARNRIASNANKEIGGGTSSGAVSDNDDPADWMTERKGKKKKKKLTGKKIKTSKTVKIGNSVSDNSNSSSSNISYESMSEPDRRVLLTQICGVISEHTRKVCTKSPKCPQHSDEQKKAVRDLFLTDAVDSYFDNLQIDVDTYEEEGDLVKESVVRSWEGEHSNTSSPADSASTSSSSSKKRDKSSFKIKIKD